MISSKNWVSHRGLVRHYGVSRGVEIVSVYSRSRMRRVVMERGEAEAVRRYRVHGVNRVCEDCRTRATPLWRMGPSGPRTLCNACGIRYRRKMRRLQPNCDSIKCESSSSLSSSTEKGLSYEELKQRQKEKQMKMLLLLDWTNKNSREKMKEIKKNPIKMGAKKVTVEDEEAALLLLSLSSAILLHQPKR